MFAMRDVLNVDDVSPLPSTTPRYERRERTWTVWSVSVLFDTVGVDTQSSHGV